MTRAVWTYYLTRDSEDDKLSKEIGVWSTKPQRIRQGGRTLWMPKTVEAGYLGDFAIVDCERWFKTIPDTDLELIICEQYAPSDKPKTSKKPRAKTVRP